MAATLAKAIPKSSAVAQAELIDAPVLPYVNWRKDPGLRKLYFYAAIICVAEATTGYDGSMLNNIRILPQWNDYFDDPQGSNLGLLTALYSIGSIASLPIVPFIADRFGCKVVIIGGCILMIIAAGIQGASHNLAMFKGARFLMGFGNSVGPYYSHKFMATSGISVHSVRTSSPPYLILENPTIIQDSPSVIQLLFIFFIPESPRWLISKDRPEEALEILAKYHANGNVNDATVQFEYAEMKETLRLEFQYRKTSSYIDFLKTRRNRYRLLLIVSIGLFSQWSGNGLVSYCATNVYDSVGITSPNSQLGINGGLSILRLIVSVTFALLCDRVGRRPLFLAATLGMLIFFIGWTVCSAVYQDSGNAGAGRAVIAFIWLFSGSCALAWSGLLVALVINQYVNPLGFQHLNPNWKLYTIYTYWIAFELVFIYIFYVETKGPTLEEIARIFDVEEAEVGQVDIAEMVNSMGEVGVPGEQKESLFV
ncbi:Lactose permease [Mycena venus]|uniref:Lactose permease n=1 Tax=Mycena venus TaxID=2733690 RepID=A0A8H6XM58_9AGAR|nr:Lactose permease [Mycena venus]